MRGVSGLRSCPAASSLDSTTSTEVLEHLRRSVRELGQTVVMVTHDRDAATYADNGPPG